MLPPSTRTQIRDGYELQKRMTEAGEAGDRQLKLVLIQYISAYDNPQLRAKPGDARARDELERIFMTMAMQSPLEPAMRKTVLEQTLSAYANYQPAEDREFLERLAVASLVRTMAADPDIDGDRDGDGD